MTYVCLFSTIPYPYILIAVSDSLIIVSVKLMMNQIIPALDREGVAVEKEEDIVSFIYSLGF